MTKRRQVSFQFTYRASTVTACQPLQFGLWVNAVNDDNLCFNGVDAPVFRRFQIVTSCDDGNPCTTDSCSGATCVHANNANACNDGNACTSGDVCSGGSCVGSPLVCTATDQCHAAGACSGGVCSNPIKTNGTACNDGNGCTTGDVCTAGVCGGTAVVCTAIDTCHNAGTCSNGACTNPVKRNGTSCNDGDSCTVADRCNGGVCRGRRRSGCTSLETAELSTEEDPAPANAAEENFGPAAEDDANNPACGVVPGGGRAMGTSLAPLLALVAGCGARLRRRQRRAS